MHTNLDHTVFKKQGESAELAELVTKFLKAQGKKEPEQIPLGQSGYRNHCEVNGIDPNAFSLRTLMTQSVQEAHAQKNEKQSIKENAIPGSINEITNNSARRKFNKSERLKAWANGKKEFTGNCLHHGEQLFKIKAQGQEHICIKCRDKNSVKQTIKRRKVQVAA